MTMCLSNVLRLQWQHALYAPLGVEMCAGWKQIMALYKHALLYYYYKHVT